MCGSAAISGRNGRLEGPRSLPARRAAAEPDGLSASPTGPEAFRRLCKEPAGMRCEKIVERSGPGRIVSIEAILLGFLCISEAWKTEAGIQGALGPTGIGMLSAECWRRRRRRGERGSSWGTRSAERGTRSGRRPRTGSGNGRGSACGANGSDRNGRQLTCFLDQCLSLGWL